MTLPKPVAGRPISVDETQPLGYRSGHTSIGTVNGTIQWRLLGPDDIGNIQLHPGDPASTITSANSWTSAVLMRKRKRTAPCR